VISDRETGKPRGFGFVSYEDPRDADDALVGMHGYSLQGREIRVDKTEARSSRARGGGGGGGFGRDNGEKPLCRLFQKGDCKYGSSCRFSHDGDAGGDSRGGDREWGRGGRDDRDRDYGRGGRDDRDSRNGRDSRRDDSRDRRDSRRDDSRDRRDSRRDDRGDSRNGRDSRRDDDRRDSRRDRDYDDR
jgi:RNA recognition motif-containing protein